MLKKMIYFFVLIFASLSIAGTYPNIIDFSPTPNSFQVEYSPKLVISFTVTNSLSQDFAIFVNGEMVVTMLSVGGYAAGKVNTNSGFKCNEGYDGNQDLTTWNVLGSGPYYYYASLTNFSWNHLSEGKKIDVSVITVSNVGDNGKYKTNNFWFVLKDSNAPTVSFLDENDNIINDNNEYSYVVPIKMIGQDTSQEDVVCYYTTDGTDPTTQSKCFTNEKIIALGQSTVLKVFAKDISGNISAIYTKDIKVLSVLKTFEKLQLDSQIIENNNLKIYFPEKDKYDINIYDIQGNQVYQKEKEFGPDNDFVGTSESLNLSHGVYIISIINSKGEKRKFKIAVK